MNVYVVREGIEALLRSVTRDDGVGNTLVSLVVESGMRLGFRIERLDLVAGVADAPVLVQASRRDLALAILDELEHGELVIGRRRGGDER